MANTFTLQSKSYDGRYLKLTCSQTIDIATNTSTISWKLESIGGSVNYYYTGPTTVTIDGQKVYYKARTGEHVFPCAKGSVNGEIVITHNGDGSKSIPVSLSTAIYTQTVSKTSDTWTLNTIPRKATISTAPNITDEDTSAAITYSNQLGAEADSVRICIDGIANYQSLSPTGSTYTFTFNDAARSAMLSKTIAEGKSTIEIEWVLETVIDGNAFYDRVKRTLTVVDAVPAMVFTVSDTNQTTLALTGNSSIFIKGYSTAQYTLTATPKKNATITKYYATNGNDRKETATGTFNNVDSGTFAYSVVDSRGIQPRLEVEKTLIPYVNVSCSATTSIEISGETNAKINVSAQGIYYNGSFGSKNNQLTLQARYKQDGGSYGAWFALSGTPTYSNNTYQCSTSFIVPKHDSSYTVEIRAVDLLTNDVAAARTLTLHPVFDWSESDFNFNVPVNISDNLNVERSVSVEGSVSIDGALSVDSINASGPIDTVGLTIMGTVPALVMEDSESDGWHYRKWDNGVAECWKTLEHSTTISKTWGSMYVGNTLMERQNYPFPFIARPIETATLLNSSNAAWIFAESQGNGVNGTYASAIYNVCRPTSVSTAQTFYINLYVRGKWK